MTADVSDRVRAIARHRQVDESEVIQQAVEKGVESLWRDTVVSKYLSGDLSRAEAVDELGEDIVRQVDTAKDAVEEDVAWGLDESGT